MTDETFCIKLSELSLGHAKNGVAILWFHDRRNPGVFLSAGTIARVIRQSGIGNPNSTLLRKGIADTGYVHPTRGGFRLKPAARRIVESWFPADFVNNSPAVDNEGGYLSSQVWLGTRGYLEKVLHQLNGCYQCQYYDAASVMLRRAIETLLIEAYERLGRRAEIDSPDGHPRMLRELVAIATSPAGLNLGRDSKQHLKELKELGDRAAHSRRFNAQKSDLDQLRSGFRVTVQELISISCLRSAH